MALKSTKNLNNYFVRHGLTCELEHISPKVNCNKIKII